LRTAIGLTQRGLAELLGVSRRAVAEWEAGSSYPKVENFKHYIALGVKHRFFSAGHESEEISALWKAAHQKVLLDEHWLCTLLNPQPPAPPLNIEEPEPSDEVRSRANWENVPAIPTLYGREEELALLTQWTVQERCRIVSVLGMGGIGKTALAVSTMH